MTDTQSITIKLPDEETTPIFTRELENLKDDYRESLLELLGKRIVITEVEDIE